MNAIQDIYMTPSDLDDINTYTIIAYQAGCRKIKFSCNWCGNVFTAPRSGNNPEHERVYVTLIRLLARISQIYRMERPEGGRFEFQGNLVIRSMDKRPIARLVRS